jgi:hypothetical protein
MKAWIYRKKLVLILALCLIFSSLALSTVYGESITKMIQVTYRNITLWANGKLIPSEQEPFVYEGRTFVPLRTIAEALDKEVNWDNAENKVLITDKASPRTMNIPIHSLGERVVTEPFAITILGAYVSEKLPYPYESKIIPGLKLIIRLQYEFMEPENSEGSFKIELQDPPPFYFMKQNGIKLQRERFGCINCESWSLRHNTNKEIFLIDYHWDEELQMDDLVLVFEPHNVYGSGMTFYSFAAFDIGEITIREE